MTKILKGCKGHPEPSDSCNCHQIPAWPLTGHAGGAELSLQQHHQQRTRPSSSCQQARGVSEAQVQFLGQQQGQRRLLAPVCAHSRPLTSQKYAAPPTEEDSGTQSEGKEDVFASILTQCQNTMLEKRNPFLFYMA